MIDDYGVLYYALFAGVAVREVIWKLLGEWRKIFQIFDSGRKC